MQGVLETFGAWKVVVAALPKLPATPLARAWRLLQLSNGAEDARGHPEQYAALVKLLWDALLKHSCHVASAAAATALAQQPLELVGELAELRPLREVVQVPALDCATASLHCIALPQKRSAILSMIRLWVCLLCSAALLECFMRYQCCEHVNEHRLQQAELCR